MLTERTLSLGDALRSAFDDMIAEAAAEVVEHEDDAADHRLATLQTIRLLLGPSTAPEIHL